jgi:hypothetical protein
MFDLIDNHISVHAIDDMINYFIYVFNILFYLY